MNWPARRSGRGTYSAFGRHACLPVKTIYIYSHFQSFLFCFRAIAVWLSKDVRLFIYQSAVLLLVSLLRVAQIRYNLCRESYPSNRQEQLIKATACVSVSSSVKLMDTNYKVRRPSILQRLRVPSSVGFDVDNIALLERKFICSCTYHLPAVLL
jgi:hypothetical protein